MTAITTNQGCDDGEMVTPTRGQARPSGRSVSSRDGRRAEFPTTGPDDPVPDRRGETEVLRLGAALRSLREDAGLTGPQLAERAGWHRGTPRAAERGRMLRRGALVVLLQALGLDDHAVEAFLDEHADGIRPEGNGSPPQRRSHPPYNHPLAPPPPEADGLGADLWRLRLEHRWSRSSMAPVLGVGRAHLWSIETGKRRPSADLLARWCRALSPDPALVVRLLAQHPTAFEGSHPATRPRPFPRAHPPRTRGDRTSSSWRAELDAMVARLEKEPEKLRLTPGQRRVLAKAIGEIADRITVLEHQVEAEELAKKAARNGHSTWKGII